MKNKLFMRATALTVSAVMMFTTLTGCADGAKSNSKNDPSQSTNTVSTKDIADSISESLRNENESQAEAVKISFDPDDYAGDLDAFVYGLIVSEYELCYNVFNAAVELDNGEMVYGIGYTDYADRYDSDDGKIFFPSGFISLIGEPEIPEDAVENGLEVIDLECEDMEHGFVLAYDTEPFTEHCVVWEQYLQYGINETGAITYNAVPDSSEYDDSLGTLYSYDSGKYLLYYGEDQSEDLKVESLSGQIDYAAVEAEMNRIIAEQNLNFSKVEIETIVAEAPAYLESALLATQAETFMGYDVSELIEKAKQLDPNEIMTITPDGIIIEVADDIPDDPDKLTKWLVGVTCGVLVIGSIAVEILVPALNKESNAISGAAVDVFIQVVLDNHTLENVNWKRVALAAYNAALYSYFSPGIEQIASEFAEQFGSKVLQVIAENSLKTISTGLLGGIEFAEFAILDEKEPDEVFDAFLEGAAIAASCQAALKIIGELGKPIAKALKRTRINNFAVKISNKVVGFVGEHKIALAKPTLENLSNPKAYIEASRRATKTLRNQNKIIKNILNRIPTDDNVNFQLLDKFGNAVSNAEFKKLGNNGFIGLKESCEDGLRELFEKNSISMIPVKNGFVDLSAFSIFDFVPKSGISNNRDANMKQYYKQLSELWTESDETMPKIIKEYLTENGLSYSPSNIKKAISQTGYRLHESIDGVVYLIKNDLHDVLPHAGGVVQAKVYAMIETATESLSYLSSINTTNVFGSLLDNAA